MRKILDRIRRKQIKNLNYTLAWVELQFEYDRIGLGCYEYLKEKYSKKLDKKLNKVFDKSFGM